MRACWFMRARDEKFRQPAYKCGTLAYLGNSRVGELQGNVGRVAFSCILTPKGIASASAELGPELSPDARAHLKARARDALTASPSSSPPRTSRCRPPR